MRFNRPIPEVHERIKKEEVDPTKYQPLVNKIIGSFAKCYGSIVTDNKDDFNSVSYIGLMRAKKTYDPDRGTFVTHAYRCITSEVIKLLKELSTEYATRVDNDDPETGTFADRLPGCIIDYERIGSMLNGTNRKLFWCIFHGCNYHKTIAMCDLKGKEGYTRAVKELREEIIEIINTTFGGQLINE